MTNIKNVCVYCGSSNAAGDVYKRAAHDMGALLAREGYGLIYGGGNVGLMGITANAVLEHGGKAIGIIPKFLQDREVRHEGLTETHIVDNMHERKMMMAERSDAFAILPGGFGTLDEFFEILTWRQLRLHAKPIILVNVQNYWSPLMEMIDTIVDTRFAKAEDRNAIQVADTVEDVAAILSGAVTTGVRADIREKV